MAEKEMRTPGPCFQDVGERQQAAAARSAESPQQAQQGHPHPLTLPPAAQAGWLCWRGAGDPAGDVPCPKHGFISYGLSGPPQPPLLGQEDTVSERQERYAGHKGRGLLRAAAEPPRQLSRSAGCIPFATMSLGAQQTVAVAFVDNGKRPHLALRRLMLGASQLRCCKGDCETRVGVLSQGCPGSCSRRPGGSLSLLPGCQRLQEVWRGPQALPFWWTGPSSGGRENLGFGPQRCPGAPARLPIQ